MAGAEQDSTGFATLKQVLGENLRPLDRRRSRAGPEHGDSALGKAVRQPGDQRRLRPHDGQVDALAPGERHQIAVRVDADGDAGGLARDPRIPRRGEEHVDQGTLADLPRQRVLATATADDQHPHGSFPPSGGSTTSR